MTTNEFPTFTVTIKGNPVTFTSTFRSLAEAYAALAAATERTQFAQDLLKAARERRLTPAQTAWLHRLAMEASSAPATVFDLDLRPIVDMMHKASDAGKRRPMIRLRLDESTQVCLSALGPKSRFAGDVIITDHRPFADRTVFGRITRDGAVIRSNRWTSAVEQLLRRLATDPARVAHQNGVATGECCFCHHPLSTRESRGVGYGPYCAAKFGLPWGDTAVADAKSKGAL